MPEVARYRLGAHGPGDAKAYDGHGASLESRNEPSGGRPAGGKLQSQGASPRPLIFECQDARLKAGGAEEADCGS